MTRKAKIWTGATLLLVLALNYALVAYPLSKKSILLRNKARVIMLSKSSDDEYFLELYRKEKLAVDKKILFLNCIALSCVIIIASWMAFGLITHKKK